MAKSSAGGGRGSVSMSGGARAVFQNIAMLSVTTNSDLMDFIRQRESAIRQIRALPRRSQQREALRDLNAAQDAFARRTGAQPTKQTIAMAAEDLGVRLYG